MSNFDDAAYVNWESDMENCILVQFILSYKDTKTVLESMEG